jgi:hypothetical protein
MNEATNNPLNCTQVEAGSWNVVPTGGGPSVQGYPSYAEGLQATVTMLTNGLYTTIIDGFMDSLPPYTMAEVIGESPWGTNGTLLAECIPESQQAVLQYFVLVEAEVFIRNPHTGEIDFISGGQRWDIGVKGAGWNDVLMSAEAQALPTPLLIEDNSGAWFGTFPAATVTK